MVRFAPVAALFVPGLVSGLSQHAGEEAGSLMQVVMNAEHVAVDDEKEAFEPLSLESEESEEPSVKAKPSVKGNPSFDRLLFAQSLYNESLRPLMLQKTMAQAEASLDAKLEKQAEAQLDAIYDKMDHSEELKLVLVQYDGTVQEMEESAEGAGDDEIPVTPVTTDGGPPPPTAPDEGGEGDEPEGESGLMQTDDELPEGGEGDELDDDAAADEGGEIDEPEDESGLMQTDGELPEGDELDDAGEGDEPDGESGLMQTEGEIPVAPETTDGGPPPPTAPDEGGEGDEPEGESGLMQPTLPPMDGLPAPPNMSDLEGLNPSELERKLKELAGNDGGSGLIQTEEEPAEWFDEPESGLTQTPGKHRKQHRHRKHRKHPKGGEGMEP